MSSKKKGSRRRVAKVAAAGAKARAGATSQTAAARRAAEAEVRALVGKFAAAHRRLVGAVRRSIRKRLPTAHEVVYEYRDCFVISFSPSGHGYEGVLAIRAGETGVKLYFNRGKGLPDPEKLLRGSGGLVRWIAVENAGVLKRPAVASLIEGAIGRNEVPFESGGVGSVEVRSTVAKRSRSQRDRT